MSELASANWFWNVINGVATDTPKTTVEIEYTDLFEHAEREVMLELEAGTWRLLAMNLAALVQGLRDDASDDEINAVIEGLEQQASVVIDIETRRLLESNPAQGEA